MSGALVRAVGLVTGWGRGIAALPASARDAANGRGVIGATPSRTPSDRMRRATRECLLAVEAVDLLVEEGGLAREEIAGAGTALVYVTAAAYAASNRAFIQGGGGALHFPYTAPSAVPAEVAIEFDLCGPYAVLIGGAAATIDALAHAASLLARGACERVLVLAVETFKECEDLHAGVPWLADRPLVEAAAAALLEPAPAHGHVPSTRAVGGMSALAMGEMSTRMMGELSLRTMGEMSARTLGGWGGHFGALPTSTGNSVSVGPLIALARAQASGASELTVRGDWRGRQASLTLGIMAHAAS